MGSFKLTTSPYEIQYSGSNALLHVSNKLHFRKPPLEFCGFQFQNCHKLSRLGMEASKMPEHVTYHLQGKSDLVESPHSKREIVTGERFVRTLLIDNYDSYTYNVYQELAVINGVPPVVVRNDEWKWVDIRYLLYEENAFDNIVLSPGPGSPTCLSDIGICLQILRECKDVPILGICLGHQALGYAHGAQIVHAPSPIHGRLSEIKHTGCELFYGIPSGRNSGFKVVRYHSLVIDPGSLPVELIPIAWTSSAHTYSYFETEEARMASNISGNWSDEHLLGDISTGRRDNGFSQCFQSSRGVNANRVLMGIMHSTRPHYGVQFHPESIATCYGRQILENFRNITLKYWSDLSFSRQRKVFHACSIRRMLLEENVPVQNGYISKFVNMHQRVVNGHKNLTLQWKKLATFANQVGGSETIFCELFEIRRLKIPSGWTAHSQTSDITAQGSGYLSFEDACGLKGSTFLEDGFLDFLEEELQSFHHQKEEFEGLPFDFFGGYIGFLGYGIKEECGMPPNSHISETPDACFFFVDQFVVVDHSNDDVYILSICDNASTSSTGRSDHGQSQRSWLDETEMKLINLKAMTCKMDRKKQFIPSTLAHYKEAFSMEKSRSKYLKDVATCMSYINDGESYELCLTMQMKKKIEKLDALGLYLYLRAKNPAPYAAWLHFSDENLFVCSSSPERFLRLDRHGVLEAKPIKGTISRGSSRDEDELKKLQLQYSEKDQAENLMIVDLLRNDLGRVCEPGSVHVPHLMELETYATVHTLVSTVRGKKKADLSPIACVRAAFPGGSMTGAPKRRSVEILDSLEDSCRGIYSGCIGFFSYNQTFDLNIVIRTIVIHKNEASVGAGGAIVALSKPADEYDETMLKASALMKALVEYEKWSEISSSSA